MKTQSTNLYTITRRCHNRLFFLLLATIAPLVLSERSEAVQFKILFEGTVVSNELKNEDPNYTGRGSKMLTLLPGDYIGASISFNTDPRFFTVPDFGTTDKLNGIGTFRPFLRDKDDDQLFPINSHDFYSSDGIITGSHVNGVSHLTKIGNILIGSTESDDAFEMRLNIDLQKWAGSFDVIGVPETLGFYGTLKANINSLPARNVPSAGTTLSFLATSSFLLVAGKRFATRKKR